MSTMKIIEVSGEYYPVHLSQGDPHLGYIHVRVEGVDELIRLTDYQPNKSGVHARLIIMEYDGWVIVRDTYESRSVLVEKEYFYSYCHDLLEKITPCLDDESVSSFMDEVGGVVI